MFILSVIAYFLGRFAFRIIFILFGWAVRIFIGKTTARENIRLYSFTGICLLWIFSVFAARLLGNTLTEILGTDAGLFARKLLTATGIFLFPVLGGIFVCGRKENFFAYALSGLKGFFYCPVMTAAFILMMIFGIIITIKRIIRKEQALFLEFKSPMSSKDIEGKIKGAYQDFGLVNGSGIDLEGEALGIFAPQETASELDLACYAFGQNFNTTPVALISAQAACINGGYLHTPYVVERVVDSEGNVLSSHDSTPVRQVVSEETSALVRQCLEYVVSSGTGRNGQVHGYRIGGKTGTADKGNTGEVVLSFMCFAPADDPKYIMLLTLDSPTGEGRGGGGTVAPYASRIMGEILPYLGVEPSYSAEELLGSDTTVNYVIGMTVADAEEKLKSKGFSVKVVGDGDTVTDQTPEGGTVIPGKSRVILYAGSEKPDTLCTVPSLVGLSPSEANMAVSSAGLLLRFTGTTDSGSGSVRVINQSEAAGAQVEAGTVISVQLSDSGVTD